MTPENNKSGGNQEGVPLFRTLLIAFSLVAILSCTSIGLLTYFLHAQGIRDQQYSLLETIRDEKISNFSAWFGERSGDMRVMAVMPRVINFMEAPYGAEVTDSKDVSKVLTTVQNAYRYEEVFLADMQGSIVFSTAELTYVPGDLPIREASLKEVINEERSIVSDVLISKIHNRPTLFILEPIFSTNTSAMIGVLGVLLDPSMNLYPLFASSNYLGQTGEILLVNTEGLAQSPLKYRDTSSIAKETIRAVPASRGAAGEFGIIAIEDYRNEPVMAAFGFIKEMNWGIVVKQDMIEINAPVLTMAQNVTGTSAGVLLITLILAFFIARQISLPALHIAETAELIGKGDLDLRVPKEGPTEIRKISSNLNEMVRLLGIQANITQAVNKIVETAGKHNNTTNLFADVLPLLMETTRSQLGIVFLVGETENKLDQILVHGLDAERVTKQLTIKPPDHLLSQSLAADQIQVFTSIPEGNEMVINTQAGETTPQALLSIPLTMRENPIGVIGLASLYDYENEAQQIANSIRPSLAQAIEICNSFEQSEIMRSELDGNNQELAATNEELTATNDELTSKSEELVRQADELKTIAEELDEQRKKATQADTLKSEFLSNMSHELRTPLNSVLSLSQLMLENGIGAAGGEDRERLEIIDRNGRRLLNLINDILDLSKIESGRIDVTVSSFSINELVDTVVAAIHPLANKKGLSVKTDIPEIPLIISDKDKLQQILLNLLSNAQKFTEAGEIGINVREAGESVVFSVWDTGIGIHENDLPYIFDEFRQVDGSTTRRFEGTGLGLAISKRLATILDGEINVQSKAGIGSTFTVTCPMVIEQQETQMKQDLENGTTVARKQRTGSDLPRILLIEDNKVSSDQITRILKSEGFSVDVSENGEKGLIKIQEHTPDGVILDLMMPEVDGFQVIEAIRATPDTAHLPILVLTAKDLTSDERNLIRPNIQQLIQKGSFDRIKLVASIRQLIGMEKDHTTKVSPSTKPVPDVIRRKDKATVLVVDDNADNLKVTGAILRTMNLEVLEAMDGREAVAIAKTSHPDIILMDIQMPFMNGIEATQLIKKDKNLSNIVVIALTAKAMMGDKEEILAAGCDDYLAKPVEPVKLKATLQKYLGQEIV